MPPKISRTRNSEERVLTIVTVPASTPLFLAHRGNVWGRREQDKAVVLDLEPRKWVNDLHGLQCLQEPFLEVSGSLVDVVGVERGTELGSPRFQCNK